MIADRNLQLRSATCTFFLFSAALGWSIALCFTGYTIKKSVPYYGDCHLKYTGDLRCKTSDGKVTYEQEISSNDKVDDDFNVCYENKYQCNCILAAYPITIIVAVTLVIVIIISVLKHSKYPVSSHIYNMTIIVLLTLSGLALFSIACALIVSLGAQNSQRLSGWILSSQVLISVLIFGSIKFIRDEEFLAEQIRNQQFNGDKNMEIKALTVL